MDKATPTPSPATPIQVTMLKPAIWMESGMAGDWHIMVQYADDAPFEYAALFYRYGYTDNATIHRAATDIAVSIGASEPVEERQRPLRAEVERLAAQAAPTADRWHDAALPPEMEQRLAPWLTNGAALHPATVNLVVRFARALSKKLAAAETKYGYSDGWLSPDWMDECRAKLMEHIAKGDPRDVAAYCAFLWHHEASTVAAQPSQAPMVHFPKHFINQGD